MRGIRAKYLVLLKGSQKYFFRYTDTPGSRKRLISKLMDIAQEERNSPSDLTMRDVARLIFMIKRQIGSSSRYLIRYFHSTPVEKTK